MMSVDYGLIAKLRKTDCGQVLPARRLDEETMGIDGPWARWETPWNPIVTGNILELNGCSSKPRLITGGEGHDLPFIEVP